jgi:hypothetical protein
MVKLPEIPQRDVLSTQAPMRGTPDLIAPFKMLSINLDQLGEGLMDAATGYAETAGAKAVQIGEDGTPRADGAPPFTGPAGAAYNRAAKMGLLSALDSKARADFTSMRQEHADDPAGFQAASKAYMDKLLSSQDPVFKAPAHQLLSGLATGHFTGLMNEKFTRDTHTSKQRLDAQRASLEDQAESLAATGGAGTPEYQQALSNLDQINKDLAANPLFSETEEAIAARSAKLAGRLGGATVVAQTRSVLKEKGWAEAEKIPEQILTDPSLGLDAVERHRFYTLARGVLNEHKAEALAERQGIRDEYEATKSLVLKDGEDISDERLQDLTTRAMKNGDAKTHTALISLAPVVRTMRDYRNLPLAERADMTRRLIGTLTGTTGNLPAGSTAGRIAAVTSAGGGNAPFALAVAERESGFKPNEGGAGTIRGAFQFTQELRDKYGITESSSLDDQTRAWNRYAADIGQDLAGRIGRQPTLPEVYLAHHFGPAGAAGMIGLAASGQGDTPTEDWVRSTFGKLSDRVWNDNPHIRAAGTVGNLVQSIKSDMERRIAKFGGDPAGALSGPTPAGDVAPALPGPDMASKVLLEAQRADLKRSIKATLPDIISTMSNGGGISEEDVQTYARMIGAVGTEEEKKRFLDAAAKHQVNIAMAPDAPAPDGQAQVFAGEAGRQRYIDALKEQFKRGGGELLATMVEHAQTHAKQMDEQLQKDIIGFGSSMFWLGDDRALAERALTPLDFSNVDVLRGQLADQAKFAAKVAQSQGVPVRSSILRPGEGDQLLAAMRSGNPGAVNATMSALSALDDQSFWATVGSKEFKDAAAGFVNQRSGPLFVAGMTALDQMFQRNPGTFRQAFTEDVEKKLATWRAGLAYETPENLQKRVQEQPEFTSKAALAAREEAAEAALKATFGNRNLTHEIANQALRAVDDRSFVGRVIPGSSLFNPDPAEPTTYAGQNFQLEAEYRELFKEQFGILGDASAAKKAADHIIGRAWGVSSATGGRVVMKFPPEKYYPTIDGKTDWITEQLRRDLGERGVPEPPAGTPEHEAWLAEEEKARAKRREAVDRVRAKNRLTLDPAQ